jgi:hypothetical protein
MSKIEIKKYLSKIGKKGGKAGAGEAKKRRTSFDSKTARKAVNKRWKKKGAEL